MQLVDNPVRGLRAFVSRHNRGFKSVKILLVVSLPKQTSTGSEALLSQLVAQKVTDLNHFGSYRVYQ